MQKQNIFPLEGVLYSKRTHPWKNDKGETGEFLYIIVETTSSFYNKRTQTTDEKRELPEVKLRNGLGFDEYEIGKPIRAMVVLRGGLRSWKDKNTGEKVSKHMSEIEAIFLEAMPIESSKDNKPNSYTYTKPTPKSDAEVFKAPNPLIDDDNTDDLPF